MKPFFPSLHSMFDVGRSMFNVLILICILLASTLPSQAIIDENENGASDIWEETYNSGALFTTFDPTADPDRDGWTNEQEAVTGTNPFDGNPPTGFLRPEITHIPAVYLSPEEEGGEPTLLSPETTSIRWTTLVGKKYTLFSSADLTPGSWIPIGGPRIGSGSILGADIPLSQPDGSIPERLFLRVAAEDSDIDGDSLTDAEEIEIGSSVYLVDTDGDGISDAAEAAAGSSPAGEDSDGDGVPDSVLYSVEFEVRQESRYMDHLVGYEVFVGADPKKRYQVNTDSEEYSISDSASYTAIEDGLHNTIFTYRVEGLYDGDPAIQQNGTHLTDWKSENSVSLGEDEYLVSSTTQTAVTGPTTTATEIFTTTTYTTPWEVKKHVAGSGEDTVERSGTETITVTARSKLTDPVTYQDLWTTYLMPEEWEEWDESDPGIFGPHNRKDYNRAYFGDAGAAEAVRDYFRNADFGFSATISDPGSSYSDYGTDHRLKSLRWRWVRFNPLTPFDLEYAAPTTARQKSFHFLVQQRNFLRDRSGSPPVITTDENLNKGVVEINCNSSEGGGWHTVDLEKFGAYKLEEPTCHADLDFSNQGYSQVWFGNLPVQVDFISRDPETGGFDNNPAIVEESDSRPEVNLDSVTASIQNNGNLAITLAGKAREQLSELLENGSGAVTAVNVYLDGQLIETLPTQAAPSGAVPIKTPWLRRDSTVSFSKTITVNSVAPGIHDIVVISNENTIGKKGWDQASILIEKQDYGAIALPNPPAFSFILPGSLTQNADSLTLQTGGQSAVLTEQAGMENSGQFVGSISLGGQARQVQVQLVENLSLANGAPDDVRAVITWEDGSGGINTTKGSWHETAANNLAFSNNTSSSTSDSWTNLQVTGVTHQANAPSRGMNPFVVRIAVPQSTTDFFGEDGVLLAELNGDEVEFKESAGLLDEAPPAGTRWFYLQSNDEPQIFCLNDALSGTVHAPATVLAAGSLDLKFKLRSNDSQALEAKCGVSRIYEIPEISGSPAASPPPASAPPYGAPPPANAPAPVVEYQIDEVKFWFELLFEDAGKNLMERYENGTTTDSGLAITMQKLWGWDHRSYKFNWLEPAYQDSGGNGTQAVLWLNRNQLHSPIDAAIALFTALQELRKTPSIYLRTGLVIDWAEILDAYAAGTAPDADVEQALRNARLGPIIETVNTAKSAYEIGFSFVPGGDLVVSSNEAERQIVEGNMTGAAVTVGLLVAPKFLHALGKYSLRALKRVKWDLGVLGTIVWTEEQLKILEDAGIGQITKSRLAKMEALGDSIRSGAITQEQVDILYKAGILELRDSTSRKILGKELKNIGANAQGKVAHHDLPICSEEPDLQIKFLKRGIDPNKAENGRFLDPEFHQLLHGKGCTGWKYGDPYVFQWDKFFEKRPTADAAAILSFRDELRSLTIQPFKTADDLNWPYPKTTP